MKDILSLLYQQRPLEFLTEKSKERLTQITDIYNRNEAYNVYLLEKEMYFKHLFLIHALYNLKNNLLNINDLDFDELPLNTPMSFNNEKYIFKGLTDKNQIKLEAEPPKRIGKHYSPLIYYVPNEKINREKITVLTASKKGVKVKDSLKHIPLLFNLDLKKPRISQSVLFIGNHKLLSDVANANFKINNKKYSYSDIFITAKLARDSLQHSYFIDKTSNIKSMRRPSIIYSNDLFQASQLLDNDYSEKKLLTCISEVVIFGDNFINDSKFSELVDFLSIASESDLRVTFYATTKLLNDYDNHSIIDKLKLYAWTPPYIYNSNKINIKLLNEGSSVTNDIEYFYEKLTTLLSEGNLNLFFKINKILSMILKQFYLSETNTSVILNELSKIEKFTIIDEKFKKNIFHLINNDYIKHYSRKLKKELESKSNPILIIPDEYLSVGRQFVKNLSLSIPVECVSDLKYFITDKDKDLVLTYQDPNKISRIINEFNAHSITFILPNYDSNKVLRPFLNIEKSIKKIQRSNNLSNNFLIDNNWHISIDMPIDLKKMTNYKDDVIDILQRNDQIEKISTSTAHPMILFESNRMIELNDQTSLFTLNEKKVIKGVDISDLTVGDQLVIFTLPTSKEIYNMDREKLINIEFRTNNGIERITEEDVLKDRRWRQRLNHYYNKFRLTPSQLADRFAKLGYKRTSSFFNSWVNMDNSFFVPHDAKFIYYIGLLTHDKDLTDNYSSYYEASLKLKRCTRKYRDGNHPDYQGKTIMEIKQEWPLTHIDFETISSIINPPN